MRRVLIIATGILLLAATFALTGSACAKIGVAQEAAAFKNGVEAYRLYWPKKPILDGTWVPPGIKRVR